MLVRERTEQGCSLWEKVHREVDSARQKALQICSQDGYTTLFLNSRLDLTMEHSVCKPEYHELFTEEEITYCKSLLGNK